VKPAEMTAANGPERGTGFVWSYLSGYYLYVSIVQINPFRPRPSHSENESLSEFISRF
jgi:hypothetical protein